MGEDPDPDHKPPEKLVCVACPHRGCHPQGGLTGLGSSVVTTVSHFCPPIGGGGSRSFYALHASKTSEAQV